MAKILTQRGIETAKPRAVRYGVRDGLVPGLRLLVHPSGAKSFTLFARINGSQLNVKIGSANVLTLGEARVRGRRLLTEIADGKDPRATRRDAANVETVEVLARRFVERHAKVHNRSWRLTERLLEREVLPRWGNRPINTITRHDVVALLDAIVDRGAPIQANRLLSVLRKMFNWTCERGGLPSSPCDRVRAPAPAVQRDRVLTDAELTQVWRGAATLGYPFGPIVQLLTLTGQRRNEVAAMRWSELDPALTLWTLPAERVKNNNVHQVPIATAARAILAGLPRFAGCDFVFTTSGRRSATGFSRAKAALDQAVPGIKPWVLHDLRRTAATGLAKLGVALPVIERLLNHTSGSFGGVAGVYQRHDFAGEKRDALERWGNHVLALVAPQP